MIVKSYGIRLPRLESRSLKYGYSNARVKAMKGLLLKGNFLDELVKVGTVEAVVELLQRSGYKNDLSTAAVKYSGSALIENAVSQNFSRTVRKLVKICPASDKDALKALLIRYDLLNLKTLMHARKIKRGYEEVQPYLIDIGGIGEEDFKRILKADDRDVLREIRRTAFAQKLLGSADDKLRANLVRAFSSMDNFTKMESGLDAYIYLLMDKVLSSVPAPEAAYIREILKKEIDAKNIIIIERLKKYGTAKEKIRSSLIKGGKLSESVIEKLIDSKDQAALGAIIRPRFPNVELKEKSLSEVEILLERSIAAQKTYAFARAVLSAGVIIGFMLLKEEEMNNLRKIAKGKEFGLSESDIKNMLV